MSDRFSNRYVNILAVFLVGTLVLLAKAAHLQLVDDTYRVKGNNIAVDEITTYPSRGFITDRNGKIIVYNNAMYDLMVTYKQIDPKMDTLKFCRLLDISKTTFIKNLDKNWRSGRYSKRKPFVFLKTISAQRYTKIQEHLYEFPGFFTRLRNVRGYPYPNAAHVIGYLGEVNRKQIEQSDGVYGLGDYVGQSGLELQYERELRGEKGVKFMLKDKFGREVEAYDGGGSDISPVSGKNLVTSLDIDLQVYCERLMENKRGSIVAIEPETGEILTMLSAPSYNPNLLVVGPNRGRNYNRILNDSLLPFFDRSVMAKYPPGSIFKTIVGLVALEEEIVTPDYAVNCPGYYQPGKANSRKFGCHAHERRVDLQKAIQHSCNSYFFRTFRDIVDQYGESIPQKGLSVFNDYLTAFGVGQPLEIDYPREKKGNNPDPKYYDRLYKNDGGWTSGKIMSVGIGQGEVEMTTLQMANLAAIIGNRGSYRLPHLAKQFQGPETSYPAPDKYRKIQQVPINKAHFQPIIEGMAAVTSGTAKQAKISDITLCGKTGTSQNAGKDHSIFFAFAPKENPKIALAVYIENGGFGGTYAAPIASLVVEKYLKDSIRSKARQRLEEKMLTANLVNPTQP
ncbi:MAG: penicillin-binding protein 2 [Bacteroidota bacterium]